MEFAQKVVLAQIQGNIPVALARLILFTAFVYLVVIGTGCAAQVHSARLFPSHDELELVHPPQRATPSPQKPLEGRTHVVQPQETLYRIARSFGVSVEALAEFNGVKDAASLKVGQVLRIPEVERKPKVPRRAENPQVNAVVSDGRFAWPVRGVLYARFGKKGREPHDGIDLAAPLGTPIQTAAAGTVLYAGEQKGYGLIVIVEHTHGLITLYAHNRDLRVVTGQKVRDGQVIATVGESGKTSGPHLHFEVRSDGRPVDPLMHLRPLSQERMARRPVPQ